MNFLHEPPDTVHHNCTPHFTTVSVCGGPTECHVALKNRGESHVEAFLIGIEAGVMQQQLAHNPARFSIHVPKQCTESFSLLCEVYGRKPESVRSLGSARDELTIPASKFDRDAEESYHDGFVEVLRAA